MLGEQVVVRSMLCDKLMIVLNSCDLGLFGRLVMGKEYSRLMSVGF